MPETRFLMFRVLHIFGASIPNPTDMKQLYITRHGKSSWDYSDIADIDRPLNARGIRNSYSMAERLLRQGARPDIIVSSPATRALSTAVIFMRVLKLPAGILRIDENIYDGDLGDLTRIITSTGPEYSCLMLFGHNPAFTVLANRFLVESVDNIPTAGIVSLTFEAENWQDLERTAPEKETFDYPKRG